MCYPTQAALASFAESGDYDIAPIAITLPADLATPINVMRKLQANSHNVFMLESASSHGEWGRYTFLGYDPAMEFTCKDGVVRMRACTGTGDGERHVRPLAGSGLDATNTERVVETDEPADLLRAILAAHRAPHIDNLPPFTGGLVGYFAYDYISYVEKSLTLSGEDADGFNDIDLMLFDKVIAFDNFAQRIYLIVNIGLGDVASSYASGREELARMESLVRNGVPAPEQPGRLTSDFTPLFTEEQYCAGVETIRKHIYEGDIFQAVLSNRLEAGFEGSLLDTYRMLRSLNPSPYLFYFASDDIEIAGSSPETLAKLENGTLSTFPLAGTRPRGATPEEDRALAEELLADEKEASEHDMLVDLGRNDLGRVAQFGTVKVSSYREILPFSHVMHLGSTVTAQLAPNADQLDVVGSILPAGTLSGAPKIRACRIIDDIEHSKRGIYGGAIGYLDFTGNLDTCIAIRLAFCKGGKVFVRSGAGIVADSVPKNEHQECANKARAVVTALRQATEGGLL